MKQLFNSVNWISDVPANVLSYFCQIIDSIMALFRVDFCGRGELADRQQKLAQMLSRLQKLSEGELYHYFSEIVSLLYYCTVCMCIILQCWHTFKYTVYINSFLQSYTISKKESYTKVMPHKQ